MVIATGDGQVFKDRFEMIDSQFQTAEGEGAGREQVPLYRGGKNVTPKDKPPIAPTAPTAPINKPIWQSQIDREHHVPLLASATMDDSGNMNGLAIDHRANLSPQDEELIHLHEATELPMMNDLVRSGMKPSEAYAKAHAHATERETVASIARWGEDGHEAYKQRMRDAAAIASQPSDRDRHPDAHTTRYALDESELGHKPIQIDVLGGGVGFHSGPGMPGKMEAAESPGLKQLYKSTDKIGEMTSGMRIKATTRDPANVNIAPKPIDKATEGLLAHSKDITPSGFRGPSASPLRGVYDDIKRQFEAEGIEMPPKEFIELGAAKKAYPEMYKFYKAKLEQDKDTKELEKVKSFENWEQSLNITRDLINKKPSLKVIEGGKDKPETVSSAAIKFSSGKVIQAPMHFDALSKGFDEGESALDMKEGFVTSKGRFVDREEAARIAGKKQPLHSSDLPKDKE